jgi:hypothetical protein
MLEIALEREVADKLQTHFVLNDKDDGRNKEASDTIMA